MIEVNLNIGKVMHASEDLQYAKDAIVSKTLIKKDKGTVTTFAFDLGQGLSEHTAPFDAMVHILDGEAEVIIDGKSQTVKAGEFIIMPANIRHALNSITSFKMMLIMIRA